MERRTRQNVENVKGRAGSRLTRKKTKSWKDTSGLRVEMKIKKLMLESKNHNHEKCNCEGCYWWVMTATVTNMGRFFQVVRNWKQLDRDEYLRIMDRAIRYKMDKKMPRKDLIKYLVKKGMNKKQAEEVAKNMLEALHMIMYKDAPSPLGLLRDI